MATERPLAPLQPLFDCADSGLIQLPAETVQLRKAAAHLGAQLRGLTPPDPGHAELEEKVMASALAGDPLPDARFLAEREIERQALEQLQQISRAIHERLEYQIRATLTDNPDALVATTLRPVHDRIVADIRKCAKVLDNELDTAVLLAASAAKRQARGDLDGLVSEYQAVRAAYRGLSRYMPVRFDVEGKLMQWRNPSTVSWRERSVPRQDADRVDPVATLINQLASGLEPWMPTSAERDGRYEELYPKSPASGQRNPRVVGVDQFGDRVSA
jgi:hypothetical protein